MGKAKSASQRKAKMLETIRVTKPCPRCQMHLNEIVKTLGHSEAVCKAEADRKAEENKKRGPVKPIRK